MFVLQASRDCRQFFPGEGWNWVQLLHWPAVIGLIILIGSIWSAVLVEMKRRQQQSGGSRGGGGDAARAAYEPISGEA